MRFPKVVASALLVLSVCVAVGCKKPSQAERAFDAADWRAGDQRIRGGMVYQLIEAKTVIGKKASEVEALLGKPNHDYSPRWVYEVDVGLRAGSGAWMYYYTIKFDDGGRVISQVVDD